MQFNNAKQQNSLTYSGKRKPQRTCSFAPVSFRAPQEPPLGALLLGKLKFLPRNNRLGGKASQGQ
jgi:hypothetical protein